MPIPVKSLDEAEYEYLVAQTDDVEVIREAINDLQGGMTKRPDLSGAERILQLLTTAEAKARDGTGGSGSV